MIKYVRTRLISKFVLVFIILGSFSSIYGQCGSCNTNGNKDWLGTVSSDWNNPANWENGTLPVAASNVVIDATLYANAPIISTASSFTPSDVVIENGGVLTVQASFTFSDDLTIRDNGSSINIQNGSSATGDDINLCGGGTINISGGAFSNDNGSGILRICDTTPGGQNTPAVNITGGTFTSTTSETPGGTNVDDFITVTGSGLYSDGDGVVLPVELISFTGKSYPNYTLLEWETASEINNSHFLVQSSIDQVEYRTIGRVGGNGTTNETKNYSFKDFSFKKVIYYRLVQFDHNGSNEILSTIRVESTLGQDDYEIRYETDRSTPITVNSETSFEVSVHDETGRNVFKSNYSNSLSIPVSSWRPGLYIIKIIGINKSIRTEKVLLTY